MVWPGASHFFNCVNSAKDNQIILECPTARWKSEKIYLGRQN